MADAGLDRRGRALGPRVRRRTRGGRRGGGRRAPRATRSPATRSSASTSARSKNWTWPIRAASARFSCRRGRAVVLQRDLDEHGRRHPRRLRAAASSARGRARARARAPRGRRRRPPRAPAAPSKTSTLRARDAARPRDLRRGRRELEAVERRREPARGELGEQRAVAAADLHQRGRPQPRPRAQLDDVAGLRARPERPPAAHPLGLVPVGERVALRVELAEVRSSRARPSPRGGRSDDPAPAARRPRERRRRARPEETCPPGAGVQRSRRSVLRGTLVANASVALRTETVLTAPTCRHAFWTRPARGVRGRRAHLAVERTQPRAAPADPDRQPVGP